MLNNQGEVVYPIKHARRSKAAHDLYPRFFQYGDAESWQRGLERLRRQYPKEHRSGSEVTSLLDQAKVVSSAHNFDNAIARQ